MDITIDIDSHFMAWFAFFLFMRNNIHKTKKKCNVPEWVSQADVICNRSLRRNLKRSNSWQMSKMSFFHK